MEVVAVEFDPARLEYEALLDHAVERECALAVFTTTYAQQELAAARLGERAQPAPVEPRWVDDQKYYLTGSALRYVPMTRLQATRINADVENAERYLSPRQIRVLSAARAGGRDWPDSFDRDLWAAWPSAWSRTISR